MNKVLKNVGIILRGIAVGITETVPGISGSTVAMIFGIYERLIYSLSLLTTKKRKEVLPFLITFANRYGYWDLYFPYLL